PHLDLTLPSIWYEQVLKSPTFTARGFTIPGVPGIVLGHNGTVAWGFTNSCVDVQDLYVEALNTDAGTYRDTDGTDKPLTVRRERIKVKGADTIVIDVRATRRGPLLTDAVAHDLDHALSLRWDAIRPGRISQALIGMNRAQNFAEFRESLRHWTAPAQNVVYADVAGNIGFQHAGEIPIRKTGNGTLPSDGTDPDAEWTGQVPYDETPWSLNPSADRIVTANDKLVDDDYPYFISVEWMNGYRGERIRSLIDAKDRHTLADSARIQTDVYSLPGEQLVPLVTALKPEPATAAGREVLAALAGWDFELTAVRGNHGGGAIAYRLFSRALQEQAFGFLGSVLPRYLGYSRTGVGGFWGLFGRSLPRLIHDIKSDDRTLLDIGVRLDSEGRVVDAKSWWTPTPTWAEAVAVALDRAGSVWGGSSAGHEAHHQLRLPGTGRRGLARQGDAISTSSIPGAGTRGPARNRFHRLRLQHPLGVVPGLSAVANHGPFAVPGDADTVWAAGAFNNASNDNAMVGPSHRHLVDLANLDASQAVLCGGQSGHPASPNYVDQVALWLKGETRTAPWTDGALERITAFSQQLIP
ncbi:MAG: penicillin acylase family protein, partial [Thermoleophilia bacterium]|nr:penicillin acylase family protein [Thermoleophilia bacterium]